MISAQPAWPAVTPPAELVRKARSKSPGFTVVQALVFGLVVADETKLKMFAADPSIAALTPAASTRYTAPESLAASENCTVLAPPAGAIPT